MDESESSPSSLPSAETLAPGSPEVVGLVSSSSEKSSTSTYSLASPAVSSVDRA